MWWSQLPTKETNLCRSSSDSFYKSSGAPLGEWGVLFAEGQDSLELSAVAIAGLAKQRQAAAPK